MEDIIKILEESGRSLDIIGIIKSLKENYTAQDLKELQTLLDEMCTKGILYQRNDMNYMLFSKSNLIKGKIEVTEKGYGFVLQEGEDLYIPRDNIRDASNNDIVIAEVTKNKGEKKEGRVLRVLERNMGNGLGEIYEESGILKVKSLDPNLKAELILETDMNLVEGQIIKLKIVEEITKNKMVVNVDKVIGHKNEPGIDILTIINEFEIPTEWSEAALEEARNMPSSLSEELIASEIRKGRRDLRDEEIFTIDGSDTKDIDDAISLKKLPNGNDLLGVHIADVHYFVKEGTALWKEAGERGNSVYVPDGVVPMFPPELSNGICSLNPEVDRFTTSCEMEIDKNGKVVRYDIFKGIIKSKKKMTYEAVNDIFDGKKVEGYEKFENTLLEMLELSKILKETKSERGELEFLSSEVKLKLDENKKVEEIIKREQRDAEKLIENFMIVANETIAKHIYNMSLPFIYRIHDRPSEKKVYEYMKFISLLGAKVTGKIHFNNVTPKELQHVLNELKENPYYKMLNKKMLRSMQKACYSPDNIGHFGLASECYTHFTSPIRRFSDLIVHASIDYYEIENEFNEVFIDQWQAFISYMSEHISKTERIAEDIEYEVQDMLMAEYMEGHIGDEYDAIIDGCLSKGFFVETVNENISGLVSLDTLKEYYVYSEEQMGYTNKKKRLVYRLGDQVRVRCIGASKIKREIDFTIAEGSNGNTQ